MSPAILSFAQRKPEDIFSVIYCAQNYHDKNSVKYDGKAPDNTIVPENTNGHYLELQYERVTRYGLILGVGVNYGIRRFDVAVVQDLSTFDADAVNNLRDQFYYHRFQTSVNYWGPRLSVGYKKQLNKHWAASARVGISQKLYFDGLWESGNGFAQYFTDDHSEERSVQVVYSEIHIGREGKSRQMLFPAKAATYDVYLGIDRHIDGSWLSNISAGVEMSRHLGKLYDGEMNFWSNGSYPLQTDFSKDVFYDRNISLGLRVSVGFSPRLTPKIHTSQNTRQSKIHMHRSNFLRNKKRDHTQ